MRYSVLGARLAMQVIAPERPEATSEEKGTIEHEAIKKIVRENWQKEIREKKNARELIGMLEVHAQNIRNILGSFDYESTCMGNITANAKFMKSSEVKEYTRIIEALATGYSYTCSKETLALLLSGLTQLSRDAKAARKYLDLFIENAKRKEFISSGRAEKLKANQELLLFELKNNEASLFRIFRKKRILLLRRRVDRLGKSMNRHGERAKRYAAITQRVREVANEIK